MSGAAVFANDHLVGVVIEAERRDTPLRAIPVILAGGWRNASKGIPESATSAAKFRQLLADQGISPQPEPVRRHTAYGARIRKLADDSKPLMDRELELDRLAQFTHSDGGYQWWTGPPASGKTALAAHFASHPPEDVDIVAYFVPQMGERDAMSFAKAVSDQLAAILDEPALQVPQREDLADQWDRAVQAARLSGRHIVLLVDGIEEDTGDPPIAQQIPTTSGGNAHVLLLAALSHVMPFR